LKDGEDAAPPLQIVLPSSRSLPVCVRSVHDNGGGGKGGSLSPPLSAVEIPRVRSKERVVPQHPRVGERRGISVSAEDRKPSCFFFFFPPPMPTLPIVRRTRKKSIRAPFRRDGQTMARPPARPLLALASNFKRAKCQPISHLCRAVSYYRGSMTRPTV